MKKILIISYHFPPIAGGGVFRTLKFVKYLPNYNWQPIILTVNHSKYHPLDYKLKQEIPEIAKIYKTPTIESRIIRYGPTKLGINNKWYLIPDAYAGWIPFAITKGKKIIELEQPDIIYTTSPPPSTHIIGLKLKEFSKKPWIADFRDPWTEIVEIDYPTKYHKGLEEKLEYQVLANADKIITVTDPIKQRFEKKYPTVKDTKINTIPNGYDSQDFEQKQKTKSNKFTITYLGSLYHTRSPDTFFKAFKKAIEENKEIKNFTQILIVGHTSKDYSNLEKKYGLAKIIKQTGFIQHQEAIKYMINADVLLLIIRAEKGGEQILTGKLFEYIATGNPIMALLPKNSIAKDLIERTNTGECLLINDVDGIKNAILKNYSRWKKSKKSSAPNWDEIHNYDRKNLTKKLVKLLEERTS